MCLGRRSPTLTHGFCVCQSATATVCLWTSPIRSLNRCESVKKEEASCPWRGGSMGISRWYWWSDRPARSRSFPSPRMLVIITPGVATLGWNSPGDQSCLFFFIVVEPDCLVMSTSGCMDSRGDVLPLRPLITEVCEPPSCTSCFTLWTGGTFWNRRSNPLTTLFLES